MEIYRELKEETGFDLPINSGYRDYDTNLRVGGVPNSSHLLGVALDLGVLPNQKKKVVKTLIKLGVRRIIVYKTHIHFDLDERKNDYIVWL